MGVPDRPRIESRNGTVPESTPGTVPESTLSPNRRQGLSPNRVPIAALDSSDEVRARLVENGTLVAGSGDMSWLLETLPLDLGEANLLDALVEDREDRV